MSMAQTPDQRVQFADFGTYAVKSGGAVAPAYPVMLSTTNTGRLQDVTNVTADTDDPVGIGWLDIEDDDLEPGAGADPRQARRVLGERRRAQGCAGARHDDAHLLAGHVPRDGQRRRDRADGRDARGALEGVMPAGLSK
jgi:hypothetical protein